MNNANRMKLSGLVAIILVAVAVGSVFTLSSTQAQPEPSLDQLALHPDELPKGSIEKEAGLTNIGDMLQPLSSSNHVGRSVPKAQSLLTYEKAYKVAAIAPSGAGGAYVGNYLYRYPDSTQAKAAATVLIEVILQEARSKLLFDKPQDAYGSVYGQAAMFVGADRDAVYWFVGVKERTLILLMVNGKASPSTQQTFERLMAVMLQR